MSLGRCDGCDKPLTAHHIGTVDAHMCVECLAENRAQLVTPRIMPRYRARYAGTCPRCHQRIVKHELVGYDVAARTAVHAGCADNIEAERERERLPL